MVFHNGGRLSRWFVCAGFGGGPGTAAGMKLASSLRWRKDAAGLVLLESRNLQDNRAIGQSAIWTEQRSIDERRVLRL